MILYYDIVLSTLVFEDKLKRLDFLDMTLNRVVNDGVDFFLKHDVTGSFMHSDRSIFQKLLFNFRYIDRNRVIVSLRPLRPLQI